MLENTRTRQYLKAVLAFLRVSREYLNLTEDAFKARSVSRKNSRIRTEVPELEEDEDNRESLLVERSSQKFLDRVTTECYVEGKVDEERVRWREQLYALTLQHIEHCDEKMTSAELEKSIVEAVATRPEMRDAAGSARGRWSYRSGGLVFVAEKPFPFDGAARKTSPAVREAVVPDEVDGGLTTYVAWKAMRDRCEAIELR